MSRTLLLSLPGLTRSLLTHVPPETELGRLVARSSLLDVKPTWPAVTCSVQASLTTGTPPDVHGIVANGLPTYRRSTDADLTDPANLTDYRRKVSFWEQSNQLLQSARVWGESRRKTALLFFQNSMPGFGGISAPAADVVITPKPEHDDDGKLASRLWTHPRDLGADLEHRLGPFPLMNYWGPLANITSSRWIISAATHVWTHHTPDLQLTYIPHLDYDLQRFGPPASPTSPPQSVRAVEDIATALDPLIAAARNSQATVLVVGEYGIDPVDRAIAPNALLLRNNLLTLTDTHEIDFAATPAWVLCDHQIGHVYLSRNASADAVADLLRSAGLEVLSPALVRHPRAGDLQVQAPRGAWLDYRWWPGVEGAVAPAFAGTVDIHRKPGYDPLELFFNPATRTIATDAGLVRGSHGRTDTTAGVLVVPPELAPTSDPSPITIVAEVLRQTFRG